MNVVSNNDSLDLNLFNHTKYSDRTPFECILAGLETVKNNTYVCYANSTQPSKLMNHIQSILTLNISFQSNYQDIVAGNYLTRDILKLVDCDYPHYWINRVPYAELFTIKKTEAVLEIAKKTNNVINFVMNNAKTFYRNYSFMTHTETTSKKIREELREEQSKTLCYESISKKNIELHRMSLFIVLLLRANIVKPWSYIEGDKRIHDFVRGRFDEKFTNISFTDYLNNRNIKQILPSIEMFNLLNPTFDYDQHYYQCKVCSMHKSLFDIARCHYLNGNGCSEDIKLLIKHYDNDKTFEAYEQEEYRLENIINSNGYYKNKSDNLEKRFRTLISFFFIFSNKYSK